MYAKKSPVIINFDSVAMADCKISSSEGKTAAYRRDIGLDSYPEVSLAEARDKARELHKQASNGIDPLEQKKRNKEAMRIQQECE